MEPFPNCTAPVLRFITSTTLKCNIDVKLFSKWKPCFNPGKWKCPRHPSIKKSSCHSVRDTESLTIIRSQWSCVPPGSNGFRRWSCSSGLSLWIPTLLCCLYIQIIPEFLYIVVVFPAHWLVQQNSNNRYSDGVLAKKMRRIGLQPGGHIPTACGNGKLFWTPKA